MMADYIRRDALREARNLAIRAYENASVFNADAIRERLKPLLDAIVDVPAANVAEVVHGEWQGEGDGYADGEIVFDVWHCSECGYCIDDGTDDPERLPKYCPNCGAKMDGGCDGV